MSCYNINMPRIFAFLLFICLPLLSAGQPYEYRAGQSQSAAAFARWEAAAAWRVSAQEAQVKNGSTSTDGLHGLSARVLVYPLRYVAVGVEGTQFSSQTLAPLVEDYKSRRLGVVGKVHLSPDTNPRIYLTLGAGKSFYRLNYVPAAHHGADKKDIFYLSGGVGLEISLYKSLFLAAEVQLFYHSQTELTAFYALSKRYSLDGNLGIGVRF